MKRFRHNRNGMSIDPIRSSLVVFNHGKGSGPWGSKIRFLASIALRHGALVESPDYSDLMDPDRRVERLLSLQLPEHDRLILVGSSMGGYVSTIASRRLRPVGLFLLAPAFYIRGYLNTDPEPFAARVSVVFGWDDEIIPADTGIAFARKHRASLHLLSGDHRLGSVLPEVGEIFDSFLAELITPEE